MKSLRWYAVMAVAAMLLSVDATAQLGKGRGGGGSPPSNSGQGGGKNPPSNSGGGSKEQGGTKSPPRENPPPRGNQGPPTKGDNNPPVRGNQGPPPPTKGDNNPPVRGNQGPPPPTKGDNSPPVRGNQGPPPPTKGDSNPPVRGNQGPPQNTKGDQNPPIRENPITKGNQNPPSNNGGSFGTGGVKPTKGNQNPPIRGENPITKGNQNPPPTTGNSNGTGGIKPIRGNDGQGLIGNVRDSRNTKGNYSGSINNGHAGSNGPTKQPPQTIRSPHGLSIPGQAIREDDVRRRRNIYRSGYYHYDPYWCDDYFWGGNYIFNPWNSHCVISPWYWYASLPGYLNYNCIRVVTIPIYVWQGRRYNYAYSNGWGNGYNNRSDLDYALDDLRDAFENANRRALSHLMPRDGRVDIYLGNRYDYSLDANEFNNLMLDGIFNSDTRNYEIVSVETYRNEAEVVARHQFNDPWGRATTVYHWYRLEETRRGYVITRFGTNDDNCWR